MSAAALLAKLGHVRPTGRSQWVACCPCHDSKSRSSLAIRELPDGRVLIHDFGGCPAEDVLGAVGLDFGDLFPDRIDTSGEVMGDRSYRSRESQRFPASDVLRAVVDDLLIVATVLRDVSNAGTATDDQVGLLFIVAGRMARAAEFANAS